MKPNIANTLDRAHPQFAGAETLRSQLQPIVQDFYKRGLFDRLAVNRIAIIKGHGAMTRCDRGHSSRGFDYPFVYKSVWIELGADLLGQGEAGRLVGLGASPTQALAFVLAHEMRHVTDPLRSSQCRATLAQAKSFFANAMDPRLPSPVNDLLRQASIEFSNCERAAFPGFNLLSTDVARAHDVAVELRADLEAKLWMQRADMWSPALMGWVIQLRALDEANNPPSKYQIGAEWPGVANAADFDEATILTITRCVGILANSPNVSAELRANAQAIALPIQMTAEPRTFMAGVKSVKRRLGF